MLSFLEYGVIYSSINCICVSQVSENCQKNAYFLLNKIIQTDCLHYTQTSPAHVHCHTITPF